MKTRCILLSILLLSCGLVFGTDPWSEPVVLSGSMTVMAEVQTASLPASAGDVLAAFVNVNGIVQLRGKALVQSAGGIPGCLIQIFTESNGENISFKVWDESAQQAYRSSQVLPSELNGMVGSFPDNLYLVNANEMVLSDPWPEPAILTDSMIVMAQVSIDMMPAASGDILAAFVNVGGIDQLRGKGNILLNAGIAGCLLQVYLETSGEQVIFKVWDNSAETIYASSQILPSEVNGTVGSWPDNLYQINSGSSAPSSDASLSMIYLEAAVLPAFNPETLIYNVFLPLGTTSAPIISASAVNPLATVQIQQAASPNSLATISVIAQNGTSTRDYQIQFTVKTLSLNLLSILEFPEDMPYVLNVQPYINSNYYTPADMTLSISNSPAISHMINGLTASLFPADDWNGTVDLTVTLAVAGSQFTVCDVLTIIVSPVNDPPVATNIQISGTPRVGSTLTASYTFSDIEGGTEGASLWQWYRIDSGILVPIPGATNLTFIPQMTEFNRLLKFAVTPVDNNGLAGNILFSVPTSYVTGLLSPSGLTALASESSILLNWLPPALNRDRPLLGYNIKCRVGPSGNYSQINTTPCTSLSYTHSNLVPQTYYYRVTAVYNEGESSTSNTASAIIVSDVANPVFDPAPGSYPNQLSVSISCITPSAIIRYTMDGSNPDESSEIYTQPIVITQSTTIKARAYRQESLFPSQIVTATYAIYVANPEDPAAPVVNGIKGVYPNPFNDKTNIRLGKKDAGQQYTLKIFNLRGECVYETVGGATGYFELEWNGKTKNGHNLASGIYLIAYKLGNECYTRKVIKL